jgi:hypothetical protein
MPLETVPDNGPSAREFVVKLATLPTWIISGLWAWSLLRASPAGFTSEYNRVLESQP